MTHCYRNGLLKLIKPISKKLTTAGGSSTLKTKFCFIILQDRLRMWHNWLLHKKRRMEVLKTWHDSTFPGHLVTIKTLKFPIILARNYKRCQGIHLIVPYLPKDGKKRPSLAPLQLTMLASRPWEKIAIDIVGEIHRPSAQAHRFIFTMVDLCSRYVEAIPVKYISVEDVADTLMSVFCPMGFPDIILSDNGSQFISRMMWSFTDMLSIPQTFNWHERKFLQQAETNAGKGHGGFPHDWDSTFRRYYLPIGRSLRKVVATAALKYLQL